MSDLERGGTEFAVAPSSAVGRIGAGRMGSAMVRRLARAGYQVAVWNRTRSKAEALRDAGVTVVDRPAGLSGHAVVFTVISDGSDLEQVLFGKNGLLTGTARPEVVIDSSTVSIADAEALRVRAADRGLILLAAPVSGNSKAVEAGKVSLAVSGPRAAYDRVRPLLSAFGGDITYVGVGELARLVKICHNVFLGVVAQSMVEVIVLAEKGGVSREAFLAFLNNSVMGSVFTRYKSPAYANLDFTPTFTPVLLRKDLELGMAASRSLEAPMPVAALVPAVGVGRRRPRPPRCRLRDAAAGASRSIRHGADIRARGRRRRPGHFAGPVWHLG